VLQKNSKFVFSFLFYGIILVDSVGMTEQIPTSISSNNATENSMADMLRLLA
jgi:hypothetical protein